MLQILGRDLVGDVSEDISSTTAKGNLECLMQDLHHVFHV